MSYVNTPTLPEFAKTFVEDYKKNVILASNDLYSEFQRKKSAWALSMASHKKRGSIDMSRIFAYKTSDDIFKKKTIQPKGKSHGVVVLVDNSSSMKSQILNVIDNAAAIALFCKRVNIPFYVLLFTTGRGEVAQSDLIIGTNLNLICSPESTPDQIRDMVFECHAYHKIGHSSANNVWRMDCTPLTMSYYGAFELAAQLKMNKLDHVTLLALTDGGGDDSFRNNKGNTLTMVTNPFNQMVYRMNDFASGVTPWGEKMAFSDTERGVVLINEMAKDMDIETHHIYLTGSSVDRYQRASIPQKYTNTKVGYSSFGNVMGFSRVTLVKTQPVYDTSNNRAFNSNIPQSASDVTSKLTRRKLTKMLSSDIIDTICRKYS